MEIIIRMAIVKYRDTKVVKNVQAAVQRFLEQDLFPNTRWLDGFMFRQENLYNLKVDETFRENKTEVAKIFMHI